MLLEINIEEHTIGGNMNNLLKLKCFSLMFSIAALIIGSIELSAAADCDRRAAVAAAAPDKLCIQWPFDNPQDSKRDCLACLTAELIPRCQIAGTSLSLGEIDKIRNQCDRLQGL